ncbi:FAD-dependent oxidoreductase [Leifsonia sp. AG29]|uniref:FAD-dependent oxidoreductase n=1 Tax=Leifsonia sp. AG29 TaxID=2598860 RepID=UPI001E3DB656|nr:FAD-dependent oxidoreductase [Leifsonia sp. AG29]
MTGRGGGMTGRPLRIVVVGYGPVAARFVEELLPAVEEGTVALTVVGAETEDAYNRVLVAEYAVGAADRDRLDVTDTEAARAAGVDIRLGATAVGLDRLKQRIVLAGGEELPYDRLVLATGARAHVPTLGGLERSRRSRGDAPTPEPDRAERPLPSGVVALRDLADARVVTPVVESAGTVVVLGAGVLGMEFALLAAERGAQVFVVHHGAAPMARNLDADGGRMLTRAARARGVAMVAHARAESVSLRADADGEPEFDGLICADGTYVPGDLLVLSCGVGARTELAHAAGLACSAGILVDEELRSWTDPDVFAIGDCAQVALRESVDAGGRVPGAPSGLIGPGWRQAAALAARLSAEARGVSFLGGTTAIAERPAAVMLKAEGVDVVAGGDASTDAWDADAEVSTWIDRARGAYLKTVVRDGALAGFVTVGLPRAGSELTLLFERAASLPAEPAALLRLDAPDAEAAAPTDPAGPEATVCWCNGVTAGRITDAIAAGSDSVECVGKDTRAGTGCGGCRGRIAALLAAAG